MLIKVSMERGNFKNTDTLLGDAVAYLVQVPPGADVCFAAPSPFTHTSCVSARGGGGEAKLFKNAYINLILFALLVFMNATRHATSK